MNRRVAGFSDEPLLFLEGNPWNDLRILRRFPNITMENLHF
jgi:hypothetical protein